MLGVVGILRCCLSLVTTCLFVALCLMISPSFLDAQWIPQFEVRPLDPLTPWERAIAAERARADSEIRVALGEGEPPLVQVEFLPFKPSSLGGADESQVGRGRRAAVLFYRSGEPHGVQALVDLDRGEVALTGTPEAGSIPLFTEEVERAFRRATQNEEVRALLGDDLEKFVVGQADGSDASPYRVEGLHIISAPEEVCHRHRCVDLVFHDPDGYVVGIQVTVDLTSGLTSVERSRR